MLKEIYDNLSEIRNKQDSLKWEKEKLQEQAEQELIKQFAKIISEDINNLEEFYLKNFADSLKGIYR